MSDLHADLIECLGMVDRADAWRCTGDELRCVDGHGCECEARGVGPVAVHEAALNLLRTHRDELLGVVADAERYRWLRDPTTPIIPEMKWAALSALDAAIDAARHGRGE